MDECAPDLPFFSEALPPPAHKGRGAIGNPDPRFEAWRREAWSDGWECAADDADKDAAPPATEIIPEAARSILTRNQSPDLPFDRSANPYRGCEHGCIYCYARPTHARVGLSPGLDFETRILHKADAAALLRQELAHPAYQCAPLALGTNTDVYQPVERQLGTTRRMLQVLAETRHPVSIVTKSALVERDIDLLAPMAAEGLAEVTFSLNTLDPELVRRWEPRAASPKRRLEAMAALTRAGVPVGVLAAPIAPGLNDHELEKVLAASREAGAVAAAYTVLRLPREVAELFRRWLEHHAPQKAARVMAVLYDLRGGTAYGGNDSRFGSRMTGLGHYADLLAQRFALASRRLGFCGFAPQDCSRFTPPQLAPAGRRRAADERQLDLF
ncbi:radical SAM protein [Azospira sp. I13]|uniref:PA0069 family radical SAM protein n=1 Tax=Azospira sp. I13 TaxID=1765050 RepID=UPI000D41F161|nr:PA0069 family radical SAM protein [Azospira sp. I13]GBG02506.1 radical SAM protein [Azospira sp. I13]